jgi:very-short-patch-repair endonuclease
VVRNSYARSTHRPVSRIARIADQQHGVFSRQQAFEAGLTRDQIDYRVSTRAFVTSDHGVYKVAGSPSTWKQRLMAACLAGPAVASHRAAGTLWSFPGMPNEIMEVTALRHRRRHAVEVTWHESRHLGERDVTTIEGIPVTRPVRTFLDLGLVLSSTELEAVLDHGLHRHLLDLATIWRRLEELGDLRPGATRVRALLDRRVAERPAESVLETRFRQLVRDAGLPKPTPQYEIRVNGSRVRVDFAYPDVEIAIELDGAAYHSGEAAKKRDRHRDLRLGAIGWRVLRFDWDEVTRTPEHVLKMLDAYLDRDNSGRDTPRT